MPPMLAARCSLLLLAVLLGAAQPLRAELAVPPLTQHVTDSAGLLTPTERDELERQLTAFEQRKGAQLAVLTVETTADEPIESYALRVAEVWKLGRKKVDDGALLLIAAKDRRLRIEVGYGLEGVLNDATSKRIIDEVITPYFKAGQFGAGISAGVARMISVIDGEPLPPPAARPAADNVDPYLLGLILAFFMAAMVRGRSGGRALTGGALSGGLTLLLTGILGAAGLSLLAACIIGLLLGQLGPPGGWSSHGRNGFPGGWFPGGLGGGGGFGGGGGGFGGGGASGGW